MDDELGGHVWGEGEENCLKRKEENPVGALRVGIQSGL